MQDFKLIKIDETATTCIFVVQTGPVTNFPFSAAAAPAICGALTAGIPGSGKRRSA
jgi:hypothetical protein